MAGSIGEWLSTNTAIKIVFPNFDLVPGWKAIEENEIALTDDRLPASSFRFYDTIPIGSDCPREAFYPEPGSSSVAWW